MIWLGIVVLSALALLPALLTLWRRNRTLDERSAALALHEAQLAELDRDLDIGMIALPEHSVARLEIQRRILAADQAPANVVDKAARARIIIALAAIPLAATGLYLTGGHPSFPAQPLKPRLEALAAQDAKAGQMIDQLKGAIAKMSPEDPTLRQGYILLGQAEASRGHDKEAIEAWRKALDMEFQPALALELAETQVHSDGHISADSLSLYRRALDAAPKDAPWRQAVEQRIAAGVHEQEQP